MMSRGPAMLLSCLLVLMPAALGPAPPAHAQRGEAPPSLPPEGRTGDAVDAQIRKADALLRLGKAGEAEALLNEVAGQAPGDARPLMALGGLMREAKRYREAVEVYDRAIAMTPSPEPQHWVRWYARGVSHERLGNWPAAEADLLRARELSPDQPMLLNYLAYSWIEQGKNMREALAMLERAVQGAPDDGYIIDSLGWAHFRLGNLREAVQHLQRAVKLVPDDPTLNDHLGDAYWRSGRQREARGQWQKALSQGPEPDQAERLREKLRSGLPRSAGARSERQ